MVELHFIQMQDEGASTYQHFEPTIALMLLMGGQMIADFHYDASPRDDAVRLELFWQGSERMGRLQVPDEVANAMVISDLEGKQELPIFSALGFAVFVAGQSGRRLCLTGDRSVWKAEWGRMIEVH
ncbi:hypothetical protein [Devosia sp. CAU 1758]